MYQPTVARFTARDPLPQNGDPVLLMNSHPYSYADNNPTRKRDPSGLDAAENFEDLLDDWDDTLRGITPALAGIHCRAWVALQRRNQGWLNNLPACPCFQCEVNSGTNTGQWTDPEPADQRFHPGAEFCVRSTPGPPPLPAPGQQCCYKNYELITGGQGAGTPDHIGPGLGYVNVLAHFWEDVRMFRQCQRAGRVALYLSVRPPNNANNCEEQVV